MKVKIESVKVTIQRELSAEQAEELGLINPEVEISAAELDEVEGASRLAIEDHTDANGAQR